MPAAFVAVPALSPNTPHFFPLPSTPTPFVLALAVPETPYTVLAAPAVAVPCTPFALVTVDEFVPVTAGVAVVLVNVPTAAMAAVGIATAATIATQTIVVSCRLVNGPQLLPAFDGFFRCRISAPPFPRPDAAIGEAFHPGCVGYNGQALPAACRKGRAMRPTDLGVTRSVAETIQLTSWWGNAPEPRAFRVRAKPACLGVRRSQ